MTISCGSLSEDLRIMQLPTSNTLLMEALSQGQPRVVSNTANYLEVGEVTAAVSTDCLAGVMGSYSGHK